MDIYIKKKLFVNIYNIYIYTWIITKTWTEIETRTCRKNYERKKDGRGKIEKSENQRTAKNGSIFFRQ